MKIHTFTTYGAGHCNIVAGRTEEALLLKLNETAKAGEPGYEDHTSMNDFVEEHNNMLDEEEMNDGDGCDYSIIDLD
tara:strand:+ start:11183 stop:11413 length:231 start_codon:yes stop_codon:yes gene_type:complete